MTDQQHFNSLTPAQAERLALLAEEMGEAIQAIGKVLRHGYFSYHPNYPDGPSNRQSLERELGDVRHCMIRLCLSGDLDEETIHRWSRRKAESVQRYLHHD